jgi:hydrogenase expression/formation protein HypC
MKIIKKDGDSGLAEIGGIKHGINLMMLPDANLGEYVIVHAGFAIERLDEKEAQLRLKLLREIEEYDINNPV